VIGKHGLIVSSGTQRGVLLPQVATERGWTPEQFLQETCAKAGMDRNAWKSSTTQIEAFTAEIFSESDFNPASDLALERPTWDNRGFEPRGVIRVRRSHPRRHLPA